MADTDFKLNAFTAKRISDMAKQLSLTDKAIARMLDINHWTVGRARRCEPGVSAATAKRMFDLLSAMVADEITYTHSDAQPFLNEYAASVFRCKGKMPMDTYCQVYGATADQARMRAMTITNLLNTQGV